MANVLYFNATISNPSSSVPIVANFNADSLTIPILDNQSDYVGCVTKINVNSFMIPCSFFKVKEPVEDINLGIYSFTLSYGNSNSSQTYLVWVPTNNTATIPTVNTTTQTKSNYYFIYSYQTMLDAMNVALKTAHQQLAQTVGGGTIDSTSYPFFTYDTNTQQLILYAPPIYDSNLQNYVTIYCNTDTAPLLHGFKVIINSYGGALGKDNIVVVKTLPDSTYYLNKQTIASVDYIVMRQEASCLSYWNSIRNIYVTSSLNTESEVFYSTANNLSYNNVLFDITPDLSGTQEALISEKQQLYSAPSLYRIFEFTDCKLGLKKINLSVVWSDNDGVLFPVYLYKNMKIDIKIMFIKKDFYNGKFLKQ